MSAGTAVAQAGLLLFVPGVLTGLAAGLRGFPVLGAAPALSLGSYALAAVVLGQLGLPWNPATVAVVGVLVPVLVLLLRRPWRRTGDRPAGLTARLLGDQREVGAARAWLGHLGPVAVWAVASLVACRVVVRATQGLQQPQQYWDAMFHANAVRLIADSQDVTPSSLAAVAQPENPDFFYPDVFHGMTALLVQLGQDSVPVAINSVLAVLPAVFAASAGLLAWVLLRRPLAAAAATGLATTATTFPYDLFFWGPLWPFATGVAITGAACALCLRFVRQPDVGSGAVAVLAVLAVLQVQTAAGAGCVLLTVIVVAVPVVQRLRAAADARARLRYVGALAAAAGVLLLLCLPLITELTGQGGGFAAVDWPVTESPGSAVGRLLTFSEEGGTPQWWLSALLLTGVLAAASGRVSGRSLTVALGLFVFQYALAAAYDTPLSQQLTSLWWNDRWRFAAMAALPSVVLGAAGVQYLADRAAGVLRALPVPEGQARTVRAVGVAVSVAVLCVALYGTVGNYAGRNEERTALGYADGPTLSRVEHEGYAQLADLHDGTGAIMNDPNDGSAWSYAEFELPVLFKSPISSPFRPEDIGADRLLLLEAFDQIDTDRAVQAAAERLGVRWVVVSEGFTAVGQVRAPGLDELDDSASLQLVTRNPEVSVYRVTLPGQS